VYEVGWLRKGDVKIGRDDSGIERRGEERSNKSTVAIQGNVGQQGWTDGVYQSTSDGMGGIGECWKLRARKGG